MARKSYGRTSSLLNVGTYQDDDSYPVGSNEWNANHSDDGVIGFDKSAQPISGNNNINVTDSFIEITTADSASGGSNDGIYTLAAITTAHSATNYPADTSNSNVKLRSNANSYTEGDLIYVVKAAGQAATTLRHQQGGAGAGKITTLDGEHKVLSATVPTILMARTIGGVVEWVEYGGGAVTTPTDIDIVANNSANETVYPTFVDGATGTQGLESDTGLNYNPSTGLLTSSLFAGALTGNVTGDASGSSATCSGLAATATALATARTIGGVSFDGTENINLAGVNAAGTQNTSGTAALATTVTCADNAANETVYPTFVDGATGAQDLETDTGLNYNPSTGLLSAVALTLSGDLTVSGTTTTINSTTLTVDDKNIELGSVDTPSDTTANLGGITLKGATDKTIIWDNANDNWTSNQDWNIAASKVFKVNNVSTLTATALGSAVVGSSLTSVGVLAGLTMGGAIAMGGNDITNGGVIFLTEQAEAESDVAGKGQIWVDTQTPCKLYFTDDAGTDTDLTAGGGATLFHLFSNSTTMTYAGQTGEAQTLGTAVGTLAAGVGDRDAYIRKIDTNNEGLFTVIHKNGALVEVQLA